MTIARGYVYDLDLGGKVGPWAGGRHPGVIVGISEQGVTVVPLSSSRPRGRDGALTYAIADGGEAVSTPINALCHLPTTIGHDKFHRERLRGRLPTGEMELIGDRLAFYLKLKV